MKYAILSDIHANCQAFEQVLKDIRGRCVDKIVCLGDIVGYGPDAEASADRVRRHVDVSLMGNHDAAVSGVITGAGFTLTALRGVKRHLEETSAKTRTWLAERPYLFAEGDMACAHGSFVEPERFHYVLTSLDALPSWAARRERMLFVGHTHVAAVFALNAAGAPVAIPPAAEIALRPDLRYVVNVGSVGYPRHEPWVTYCLYDATARTLAFRRLPFDFADFEKRMAKRGVELPVWFERVRGELAR